MRKRGLHIYVEGLDDDKFVNNIITPIFKKKYNSVKVIQYAQSTPSDRKKLCNFLKSSIEIGYDYIFLTDLHATPCVPAKKTNIVRKFKSIDKNKIIVIVKEIESWYLAGLDDEESNRFRIHPSKIKTTDNITKEQFNSLIPKKFDSRIDFLAETLKCFSIETAKKKNTSFRYFVEKYLY